MTNLEPFDPELVPGQLQIPSDWKAVFGREAPLIVEVGCGGGRFIIGQAEATPNADFIAVEPAGKYFGKLKARVAKRRLSNLRVFRTDAVDLIASCFPDHCVDTYHVYFPDPWPKDRHHKRRIFSDYFCAQLRRTLKPDGVLMFATDHAEYLSVLMPSLRAALDVTMHPEPWEDAPEGRTNFEIKYIKQGRPIWRLEARVPKA